MFFHFLFACLVLFDSFYHGATIELLFGAESVWIFSKLFTANLSLVQADAPLENQGLESKKTGFGEDEFPSDVQSYLLRMGANEPPNIF